MPARDKRDNFMSHALQVKHFGVQMKMLLAVRAAGSASDASSSGTEDSQLKACVHGMMKLDHFQNYSKGWEQQHHHRHC